VVGVLNQQKIVIYAIMGVFILVLILLILLTQLILLTPLILLILLYLLKEDVILANVDVQKKMEKK
jgi:multisubunit Na+/H+ antiporter MnhE subunit